MIKKLTIVLFTISFISCTKKYDWECKCQIYHDSVSEVKTETLKHMIKPDADRICAKWGEDISPPGAVHECVTN